ncbi:TPA: LOW QUALITY PROTEIN: hypothetical protein N0F65_000318, partial [Lagenidium giganteum]
FPVEPTHFVPILPLLLVNGSEGIGTGWSTNIPSFHPVEIIDNLLAMLDADIRGHVATNAAVVQGFASPVQWIKTQSFMFSLNGVGPCREIGSAPTLTNMALRTLQFGDFPETERERDRDAVHFEVENTLPSASEHRKRLRGTSSNGGITIASTSCGGSVCACTSVCASAATVGTS